MKTGLQITNLMNLDPENPVPFSYGAGSSLFNYSFKGKRYVPFLGPDDNFAKQLLGARLASTTQNACVNSIVQSVLGKGLFVKDVANIDSDFERWLTEINNDSDGVDDIIRSTTDGYFGQGNHFIEVVRGSVSGSKYVKVYEHPLIYCRVGALDPETGNPDTYIISKTLAKNGYIPKAKEEKEIPAYKKNRLDKSKNWISFDGGATERTVIHFKHKVNELDFYGLPPSIAGLRYQIIEAESAQYNIDLFENNMVVGGMLFLKGAMTVEEAQAQAKNIMMSHIGKGKTGRIAVVSSEQGLDDVDWKPYSTEKEGSFIELDKRIEEKIVAANGWDKRLAGLDRDGGLTNADGNLSQIYDMRDLLILKPYRKKVLDQIIKPIIGIYADWLNKKEVLKYEFDFKIELPLSFYGTVSPETYITVGEARDNAKLINTDTTKDKEKYCAEIKLRPANAAKTATDVQQK